MFYYSPKILLHTWPKPRNKGLPALILRSASLQRVHNASMVFHHGSEFGDGGLPVFQSFVDLDLMPLHQFRDPLDDGLPTSCRCRSLELALVNTAAVGNDFETMPHTQWGNEGEVLPDQCA